MSDFMAEAVVVARGLLMAHSKAMKSACRPIARVLSAFSEYTMAREFTGARLREANETLEALCRRWFIADMYLEHVWAPGTAERLDVLHSGGGEAGRHQMQSEVEFIQLASFEAALMQARSCVDALQRHAMVVTDPAGRMGPLPDKSGFKQFRVQMERRYNCGDVIAGQFLAYVSVAVWSDGKWGDVLSGLRNRSAHGETLSPERRAVDTGAWDVALEWPAIDGRGLERLAQDILNGLFDLMKTMVELLYHVRWASLSNPSQVHQERAKRLVTTV